MPTLEARGVEIMWRERGEGPAILLVHETAANGEVWDAVGEALAPRARAISYDRRGWGASSAPEDYRRTTVEEQSEDAAALLESAKAAPAVVVGAGIGGIVALDLLLRRPDLVAGTLLVEPPVLQLLPMATEALSDDRRRLEVAAGAGEDVIDLYLSGGLQALGGGVSRLPAELIAAARERPASVVAEMGIATGLEDAAAAPRLRRAAKHDRHRSLDSAAPAGRFRRARRPARRKLRRGGGLGSGCAARGRAGRGRRAGAGAQSVAGSGSASTSITPPRRASTAPLSSRTAMIAVGIAASTVTTASVQNAARPRPVPGRRRPEAASEAKSRWKVSRLSSVCHIDAIPGPARWRTRRSSSPRRASSSDAALRVGSMP